MKIANQEPVQIYFKDMSYGDVFKYCGDVYIKLEKFCFAQTASAAPSAVGNALLLNQRAPSAAGNAFCNFADDCRVQAHYPNATLHLEPPK